MSNVTGNFSNLTQSPQGHVDGIFVYPLPVTITVLIITSMVTSCTILGNLMVFLSFYLERLIRRSASNYLIFSMAISDLMIGAMSTGLYPISVLLGYWPYGWMYCQFWFVSTVSIFMVTQQSSFVIAMERYLSIRYPHKIHKWRTKRKILIVLLVLWIHCFLFIIVAYAFWRIDSAPDFSQERPRCQLKLDTLPRTIILTVVFWLRPMALIIIYGYLYKVASTLNKTNRKSMISYNDFSLSTKTNEVTSFRNQYSFQEHDDSNQRTLQFSKEEAKWGRDVKCKNRNIFQTDHKKVSRSRDNSSSRTTVKSSHENVQHNNNHNAVIGGEQYKVMNNRHKIMTDRFYANLLGVFIDTNSNSNLASDKDKSTVVSNQGHDEVVTSNFNVCDDTHTETQKQHGMLTISVSGSTDTANMKTVTSSINARKSTSKALRTISFILVAYMISYGPHACYITLLDILGAKPIPYVFYILFWLNHLNSCLNPFMYAFVNPLFKATFLRILRCDLRRNQLT